MICCNALFVALPVLFLLITVDLFQPRYPEILPAPGLRLHAWGYSRTPGHDRPPERSAERTPVAERPKAPRGFPLYLHLITAQVNEHGELAEIGELRPRPGPLLKLPAPSIRGTDQHEVIFGRRIRRVGHDPSLPG
jgi:hypothetical protein